jgi:hypothetical protein
MIEMFEKSDYNKSPNIILFQQAKEIFGGYASDGWSVSNTVRGNNTCFLFNLT